MKIVIAIEMGTLRSEIAASSGLIQIIIARMPMMVNTAVMICVRLCCSVLAMLSMSLVKRLSVSPREWSSKYLSGRRASFRSTSRRSL